MHKIQGLFGKGLTYNCLVNSIPNDKFLDVNKLEAFAEDKLKVDKMKIFCLLLDRADNNVGKGENAGLQHFLVFPQCSKAFFFRVVKSRDCLVQS